MSFSGFLLVLSAIWCIIHICYRFGKLQNALLIPPPVNTTVRRSFLGVPRHTSVLLNTLHLRISTTRWNARHDQRISFFAKRENSATSALFKGGYNLGIVFGAVGMIAAVVICLSSFWFVFQEWLYASGYVDTGGPTLLKRMTMEDASTLTHNSFSRFATVKPIVCIHKVCSVKCNSPPAQIPGLTVPLNHLPIILFGVFISQVVHEFGHAIGAAMSEISTFLHPIPFLTCSNPRESLALLSAGVSLTIFLPAAFVTFSAAAMNNLNRQARSRVIAAGPFHNLIFWCWLMLLVQLGFENVIAFISGYKDVSSIGKVVVDVNTVRAPPALQEILVNFYRIPPSSHICHPVQS